MEREKDSKKKVKKKGTEGWGKALKEDRKKKKGWTEGNGMRERQRKKTRKREWRKEGLREGGRHEARIGRKERMDGGHSAGGVAVVRHDTTSSVAAREAADDASFPLL